MLEDGIMAFALLGAGWVLWLLVALSVLCLAISFERLLFLARDGSDRSALRAAFVHFGDDSTAGGNAVETLRAKVAGLDGFEARVLQSGLVATRWGSDATEKAFASSIGAEKLKMDRGLVVLATVGANAPFVGLFGTVLGIIQSFHDLAVNTAEASEAVMAGISEALVATAVGLLVAIPAVVLYNTFTRWNRSRVSRVESLANLVLSRVATAHGDHDRAGHGRAVG